jgi:LPP20 lipoprotein
MRWKSAGTIVARLGLLVGAAVETGCGGTPAAVQSRASLVPKNAPQWIVRGSGAFNDGKRAFYGVGVVQGVRSVGLARDAAASRARDDLARTIEVFTRSLYKDYQSSLGDVGAQAATDQQLIEQTTKEYTEATLSGVGIVEYWSDERAGALYALAKLDFEAAENQFNRLNKLSADAQEYIRRNAERMFDELEQERHPKPPKP